MSKPLSISNIAWPAARLGELLEILARKANMRVQVKQLPQPPDHLLADLGAEALNQWLNNAAGFLNLEAEPISVLYSDIGLLMQTSGPAIIRLPGEKEANDPGFVALISGNKHHVKIICPDFRTRRVRSKYLSAFITFSLEGQLGEMIDEVLIDAQIPEERRNKAHKVILNDQLGSLRIEAGWILRLPARADLSSRFREHGLYRSFYIVIIIYFIQQIISIASWFVIGRGIFQGHFETGWIMAWAILLLSTIPLSLTVNNAQSELSMGAGAIFKQRLLQGALKLEPDEIRHQGMGQFLGRVMESEAVEMLALSGGFTSLLSFIEIGLAMVILSKGPTGAIAVWSLILWCALTIFMIWRYSIASQAWAVSYRGMTNDIVEKMVGHRTRLVQEDPLHWHDSEDKTLEDYLRLSENVDKIGVQINSVVSRGWTIIGLSGLAISFVTGAPSAASLAIGLGGILLATQGLNKLAGGSQSLVGLLIAWKQVGPLFKSAKRSTELPDLNFIPPASPTQTKNQKTTNQDKEIARKQPVLIARDLVFRYRSQGKPIIQDCSMQIYPGDRILLEGPSGGGKTTLGALLTGLRLPESGTLLLWGYDRKILGSEEWRRRVVMAPQFQENYVFSETFAFNLLMGRRWPPSTEDLEEAEHICNELGLGDLVQRMPSGFQQMLGESGWQLSHGEKSRLFIARALLQQSDLMILDESFGALDPENLGLAMQSVLDRANSVVVIAHP